MVKNIEFLCFSNDNVEVSDWDEFMNRLHKAIYGDALGLVDPYFLANSKAMISSLFAYRCLPRDYINKRIAANVVYAATRAKIKIKPRINAICEIMPQLRPWLSECSQFVKTNPNQRSVIKTDKPIIL